MESQGIIRSKYDRMSNPPALRPTERDERLLQAIFDYGGFLTARHLHNMFFSGKDQRTMERRISKLYHNQYLEWPSLEQRRTRPIPEPLYWLSWKGILLVASKLGLEIEPPISPTSNQLRLLRQRLRSQGISWLNEPHWIQLSHDIKVIDVRLAFEHAVQALSYVSLTECITESAFRTNPDTILVPGESQARGVIPDLYLHLVDENKKAEGLAEFHARFLFEIDMATHDTLRFEEQKYQAYAAYLGSPAFKKRFDAETGHWLVVTTGRKRLENLLRRVKYAGGNKAHFFFFSTFQQVLGNDPLRAPIWVHPGKEQPQALIVDGNNRQTKPTVIYQARD